MNTRPFYLVEMPDGTQAHLYDQTAIQGWVRIFPLTPSGKEKAFHIPAQLTNLIIHGRKDEIK